MVKPEMMCHQLLGKLLRGDQIPHISGKGADDLVAGSQVQILEVIAELVLERGG